MPPETDPRAGNRVLRARCRETLLLRSFHLLRESWTQNDRDQCALNRQLLRMVSESYFKDLDRKKEFHGITFADCHKRAGYMAKWIMKFRPVQLSVEDARVRALLSNEHFALTVAFKFLRISPTSIAPELYKHLVYALRFRALDANAWALSFYLLQKTCGVSEAAHMP